MVHVYLISQIWNLVSSNLSTVHTVLTYNAVVCSSFKVTDTMLFSLVVLLAYMTIGQKQVDKFINLRTPNIGHTKIDGEQNLHTWSSCNIMVGMCSMVLPHHGHLLPCRHLARGGVSKRRNQLLQSNVTWLLQILQPQIMPVNTWLTTLQQWQK